MADCILTQFEHHQEELGLIGKLILAYGELEFGVMDLVRAVMDNNVEVAVKALYRLRSESNRLELADALIAPAMRGKRYGGHWNEAYCALKICKNIRNQFAHGQFVADDGLLRFGDMDEAAASKNEKFNIRLRPIHIETLKEQFSYFEYAQHVVLWIADQVRLETGQKRLIEGKVVKPKKVAPPNYDSRGEARPPRLSARGNQRPQEEPHQ